MKLKVFIHTNQQQLLGAKVGKYSYEKMSKHRDKFQVELIELDNHPELLNREGQIFLREGLKKRWKNSDLQSFTPLRFLPPQLMGYEGKALITDPDVFALGDIYELLQRDMEGRSIICRKVWSKKGKMHYASSVMLLDCAKLRHWDFQKNLDDLFSQKVDYRDWISLFLEDESTIGDLEEQWNDFDHLDENTKLLHNTGRPTQPWKTGLPIDYFPKYPEKKLFGVVSKPMLRGLATLAAGRGYRPYGSYVQHPDNKQEQLFMSLLKECLDQGIVSEQEINQGIASGDLRKDLLEVTYATEAQASI